ncbi:nucleotidyltransferase family protein [uncultured Ferrovibrio sp.]|jgi:Nucleoside-diphosphate-sugar pyrophosphorylase involved in lipopolysaccharide biosynthesis/translation initiation factor 2B, gamma/epsilon subunits (eIF-2Bgamma/eIF-2Bepsilon)|uniref:nucleotidyltransferase family protein n=1 Tax=uncultured Ferrovibrio sp. TaxID=1576913 RepID=UPI002609753A|nr:nucleotidyltransferase family protein [uncultured Ferrovibrio sp.]
MISIPATAMVLAAGLGTRLRPLTEHTPKPLIKVAGQTLLDRCLDRLVEAGVQRAVVNIHWLGQQIRDHLASRRDIEIVISDESDLLLETGGGIAKALPLLGDAPFISVNADLIWRDAVSGGNSLRQLAMAFDQNAMDALLLLQPREKATGHNGAGDFNLAPSGQLSRRGEASQAAFVYTGVQILQPRLFTGSPAGAFSLNLLYDRAIAAGRLYGLPHQGDWVDVGSPAGLAAAEAMFNGERD